MDMPHVKRRGNLRSVHFSSVSELMNCKTQIGNDKSRFDHFKNGEEGDGADWFCHFKNTKEVLLAGIVGDDKLYENLKLKIRQLDKITGSCTLDEKKVIQKVKRVRKIGDFGDEIDIHKVYSGNSDVAWTSRVRQEIDVQHRMVTIFVNIGGRAYENANASLWRAAVAVKLQRDLEAAGKAVKIIVGGICSGLYRRGGDLVTASVVIKHYDEKLSLERTSVMCNIAFHRSAIFMARLCTGKETDGAMGSSFDLTEKQMPIHIQQEVEAGHTKCAVIGRASSLQSAVVELQKCYGALDSMKVKS